MFHQCYWTFMTYQKSCEVQTGMNRIGANSGVQVVQTVIQRNLDVLSDLYGLNLCAVKCQVMCIMWWTG